MTQFTITAVRCHFCDTAPFMRTEGDVRSCECENITVSEDGLFARQADSYTHEANIPTKTAQAVLVADFEECKDKFGLLRHASRLIPHMRNVDRVVVKSVRTSYFDSADGMLSLVD